VWRVCGGCVDGVWIECGWGVDGAEREIYIYVHICIHIYTWPGIQASG